MSEATDRYEARLQKRPKNIQYPNLPVVDYKQDIIETLSKHQVLVLAGQTGSGKTTQLPKICIDAGLADHGLIGVTQPRRIAARAVATRIAEELRQKPGEAIGYQTRFEQCYAQDGFVKVATDGLLLAEIQRDPYLNNYSCVIVDEAHERSLNIDFLLGYFKKLLPKRPEFKLIITSATINPEQLSTYFDDAPMISVPGRQFPVDILYRPLATENATDNSNDNQSNNDRNSSDNGVSLPHAIADACDEAWRSSKGEGDILVFLSGEREIQEAERALKARKWRNTEVLSLYGRLSGSDQQKIFHPGDMRRVVLSTNIAETSITVPRIRFVIDSGLARISRYSPTSKLQRLPIEPISQASANQRAGRCGRLMPGICIRLYDEADFVSRDEYTAPEIQRVNLASVLLQMLSMRLGNIQDFPFLTPPDSRAINDGYKTLEMLAAVKTGKHQQYQLTEIGKQMARMPIDPKLARIVIAAHKLGALQECLAIIAALNVQDIRFKPKEKSAQAEQAHAEYRDPNSDLMFYWNCWNDLQQNKKTLSNNGFAKYCQQKYLRYLRVREWQEVYRQIERILKNLKWSVNDKPASFEAIHQSLMTGFISQVATLHEDRWFIGPRGQKIQIFPGSKLSKKPPKWIVSGLWLETRQVYAHEVAKIEPEWIVSVAPELLKTHYGEPYWQKKTSRVVAKATKTLYGLIVQNEALVDYVAINADVSREIFIQQGLVAGEYFTRAKFLRHNKAVLAEVEALEAQHRRRDLQVTDIELAEKFDKLLPAEVVDSKSFERWYRFESKKQPDLLCFTQADFLQVDETEEALPTELDCGVVSVDLHYHFEVGSDDDGVTAVIPLAVLNQLTRLPFEWLVPSMLDDKVIAFIKSLPKPIRKFLVPAPDYAVAAVEKLRQFDKTNHSLITELSKIFTRLAGQPIDVSLLDESRLEPHHRMRFEVVDTARGNAILATGRDLTELQQSLSSDASKAFGALKEKVANHASASAQPASNTKSGDQRSKSKNSIQQPKAIPIEIPTWSDQPLPDQLTQQQDGLTVTVFPGLRWVKGVLRTELYETASVSETQSRSALIMAIQAKIPDKFNYIGKKLPDLQALKLSLIGLTEEQTFIDDLLYRLTDDVFLSDQLPATTTKLASCIDSGKSKLIPAATEMVERLSKSMAEWRKVRQRLNDLAESGKTAFWKESIADVEAQLSKLIYSRFLRHIPMTQLREYQRYCKAIGLRLDKLQAGGYERDKQMMANYQPIELEIEKRIEQYQTLKMTVPSSLWECRWLLQELRVSLFAQALGTKKPVSIKRIENHWSDVKKQTHIPGVIE